MTRPRVAAVVVTALVLFAIATPLLAPSSWSQVDLSRARCGPSQDHWFGSDRSGRDLFLRTAQALRLSLSIAVTSALGATLLGGVVGTVSGMAGGVADAVLMRLTDAVNALPSLLVGMVIVAMLRGSFSALVLSIVLTHWTTPARVVRSITISIRAAEYVEAAYLLGIGRVAVVVRHVFPTAAGQIVVVLVLLLPHAIWQESSLSFLGLGIPSSEASLGTLLANARTEVLIGGWWTLAFPGGVLVTVTAASEVLLESVRQRITGGASWTV